MDHDVVSARGAFQRQSSCPTLLIATRLFGAGGRPWMWRQAVAIGNFDKHVVCWERHNCETQPTRDICEHIMPGNPAPYDDAGRWLHRCRAIAHGNFYASVGAERVRLDRLFENLAPNVILCQFGDVAMRLLPGAWRAGIPVVAHFHGDFAFRRNRWYRWSLLRSMPHFAAIVVVTADERKWLQDHGMPAHKIHYIPCGAPTDLFRPAADRGRCETVRFVMVSRLQAEKGCDISIEAFSRVAASSGNARLSVFGEGEEQPGLERLAERLGVRDSIVFHGHVDEATLARELPAHDIFIQHSRIKEGSPVSIVEAMACGLPVVSTAIGGIVDQVLPGETGFIVGDGDVAGMAEAMARLAADGGLRRRLGKAARAHCAQRHDAAAQAKRLETLLMRVSGRSG